MKNLYVILEKMTVHSLSNIKDLFANAIYDDLILIFSEMLRMNLSMTSLLELCF